MKFAAFVLAEVADVGKDAMQLRVPFDEKELIGENKQFLFDGMQTIKNVQVVLASDTEAVNGVAGAAQIAGTAVPGKPACMFF